MKDDLRKACSEFSTEEVVEIVKSIPHWNLSTSDYLMLGIMKRFEGRCSPSKIRPIVEKFIGIVS